MTFAQLDCCGRRRLCEIRRGYPFLLACPCCCVRACVAASGTTVQLQTSIGIKYWRWTYQQRTYTRGRMQAGWGSSRYTTKNMHDGKKFATRREPACNQSWFLLITLLVVGKGEVGAFFSGIQPVKLGSIAYCGSSKRPCKSPETARLATFHPPMCTGSYD